MKTPHFLFRQPKQVIHVRCIHRSATLRRTQNCLPASYYRGGTSRALIFRREHLPQDTTQGPSIFRATIGSPDPNGRQLNGIGGGLSSLSKVCVVGLSQRDDADVDYTFAAVGIKSDEVDFSSNCGNMISAIGPFAVDSGMAKAENGKAVVRIHNTNTGKIIHSHFRAEGGEAVVEGNFAIDGVAGTGAKIKLAFLNPAGSKTGHTLPTGSVTNTFDGVKATCIDVGNPCVFISASSLGVEGGILADAIEAHPDLMPRLESIRRQAAVAMGVADDVNNVPGSIPKIAMASAPHEHLLLSGEKVGLGYCDVIVRAVSVGQPHRAVPITVAMAIAAASRLEGSTVYDCTAKEPVDKDGITIGHNSGKLLVGINFEKDGSVRDATVFRTARRILDGNVYWTWR